VPQQEYKDKRGGMKGVLGFPKDCLEDQILTSIREAVIATDDNGNALIVTSALECGKTVVGVKGDEIYVTKNLTNLDDDEANNLLAVGKLKFRTVQDKIRDTGFLVQEGDDADAKSSLDSTALQVWKDQMKGSLVAGFQMAMRQGPICEEPVRHVLIVLEGLEVALKESTEAENRYTTATPLSGGMVAAALRIGIRSALLYVLDPIHLRHVCWLRHVYWLFSTRSRHLLFVPLSDRDLLALSKVI
jgi:hypothetical protein